MFSNTAYEALYQIIGLELHSKFIEVITSESFFKGLILLIFGAMFFITLVKFISRYIPGSLVEKRHVPLSKFMKISACLFLGLAILRVGTNSEVLDYKGGNWADNKYVQREHTDVVSGYRVSILFSLISGTAEEFSALLSRIIDGLFAKGNSQLETPDFFYKAVMYAGAAAIDNPALRSELQFYTNECFLKVLPEVERDGSQSSLDQLFRISNEAEKGLSMIPLELGNGRQSNCLEVKDQVRSHLIDFASEQVGGLPESTREKYFGNYFDSTSYWNYTASMALVNYYMDDHEGRLGIQKGAESMGTASSVFQTLNRFVRWDGWLGALGFRTTQGASEAASRSQEFSEHLARAPHVAGFIKMILIAIFPWLIFFVVAGYWRVLVIWFWIYFSVLMWAPLWTLLYHIMLGIAMSSEVMQAFGNLHDGVSLYSAALVNSRMYYVYSIYSWVQLLVGTLTTGTVVMFLKPMLGESDTEEKPEFLDPATGVASSVMKAMI